MIPMNELRSDGRERRVLCGKLRAKAGGKHDDKEERSSPGTLEGYAAVFNEETDLGWFRESIAPGAFADSIEEDDQRALVNHDTSLVIGRRSNGTLRLKEDAEGLQAEIDLPDTTYARDLHAAVERGDIDGMSIGFEVQREEREVGDTAKGETDLWRVTRAKLYEVSPVTFPAYEGTSVSARSKERRESEKKRAGAGLDPSATIKRQEQRLRMLKLRMEDMQ